MQTPSADMSGDGTGNPHDAADPGRKLGASAKDRPQLMMATMGESRDGQRIASGKCLDPGKVQGQKFVGVGIS